MFSKLIAGDADAAVDKLNAPSGLLAL